MLQKYGGRAGGGAAIVIAVVLYAWSLLYSTKFEPLLIMAVLLLLPLGIYLVARASAVAPNEHPLQVRLDGPGEPGSLKRGAWAHAQLRRGRSLRTVVLAVLITSLALFVNNHVTGSICSVDPKVKATTKGQEGLTRQPGKTRQNQQTDQKGSAKGWPSFACSSSELVWETHVDRRGKGGVAVLRQKKSLAKVAFDNDVNPAALGAANPAAVLDRATSESLNSALTRADPNVQGSSITLQEAGRILGMTAEGIATNHASSTLGADQRLMIPSERPYDPRQWIDWLLWTLVGVAAFLLVEIARHLRAVPNGANGEGDFLSETSWYWTQLTTGPLIAFVILLLFTHINVDLLTGDEAAVEVNLRQYPIDLLIVPAFLLGFYSRVTRELLDQITRTVFRSAWRAANGTFQVRIKGQTDNEVSSTVMFETDPSTAVAWSATAGTIDAGGVYQPPPQVSRPTQVFVTAVAPSSGQAATREISVVKHRFNVVTAAPDNQLPQGQPLQLNVQPPVPAPDDVNVQWDVVTPSQGGVTLAPANGNQTSVTAPATLVGKTVTIQATYAGLSKKIDLLVV